MLLAIDCGNTQTVIGLFNEHELVDHWRIATASDRTSDELALMFQQFLGFHGFSFDAQVSGVRQSRPGVPRVTARAARDDRALLRLRGNGGGTRRAHRHADPLRRAKNVGADRIANAVGCVTDLFGGPTIVVDFGTANTVDAVERQGRVPLGRPAIFPGIRDLDGRAVRARRRSAQRGAGRAQERPSASRPSRRSNRAPSTATAGQVDAIVHRFEAELGPSSVGRHGRSRRADHAPLPRRSSTTSPGSRCRGSASSTRRNH